MNGRLRRAGWLVACAALAVFLQSFFRQPASPVLHVAIVAFAVAAAVVPSTALLVLAGLGPLTTIIFNLAHGTAGSVQFGETVALSFLAGWTARMAWTGEPLKMSRLVRVATLLLVAAAAASALVSWSGMRTELQNEPVSQLLQWYVLRDYPLRPPGGEPLTAAVVFSAGLLIVLAAANICAFSSDLRFSLLRMMVCGATAAAAINIMRIVVAALEHPNVAHALGTYASTLRVNVHYADLNAAGSYFALTMMIAAGMYARHRWFAAISSTVIAGGLWLTGSRVALAAVFAMVSIMVFVAWRRTGSSRTRIALAVSAAVVIGAAAVMFSRYPAGRNEAAASAFRFRVDLARAGLQMAAERPLTGVGLGRFYRLSSDYAPAALARLGFARENAHNQFIQVLAELGVPALFGFLLLTAGVCRQALRSEVPRPPHVEWLAAGIGAFLLTCLGGHPLVVPDTAYVFFFAAGLAAAPMQPQPPVAARGWRIAVAAAIVMLVASLPLRWARAAREADVSVVTSGLSAWQRDADGRRYRWAGNRAVFYRPSVDRTLILPLKYGTETLGPIEIRIFVDGQEADRVRLQSDEGWKTVRLVLHRRPVARYRRIDLVAAPVDQSSTSNEVSSRSDGGLFRLGRSADE